MAERAVPTVVVLGSLLLLLAACDTGESSLLTPTPAPAYLTEEIPPCEPVAGSKVDPCEPDASSLMSGGGLENAGSAPWGLRYYLGGGEGRSDVHVAHLVLRGTFLPGTARCTYNGLPFRPPPYLARSGLASFSNSVLVNCYADVRVNAYVLGSGPPILTVMPEKQNYRFDNEQEYADRLRSTLETMMIEGGTLGYTIRVPEGGLEGREMILFIGPTVDVSTEAWRVYIAWDVQRREDGTAIAVHPFRNDWRVDYDFYTFHSQLEMELPAFAQAVTTANHERIAEYGGRIAADEGYPMLVMDANQLTQFMTDIGANDHPGGPPVQPPPPCGLAVPDQVDNPGLVRDCMTLLAAKDTLRGAGSLNWGTGTTIGGWDGLKISSDPSGITKLELSDEDLSGTIPPELGGLFELTHLDLSSNSLTGEIPRELGRLSNLESLKLTGNSLSGCIPIALKDVATNDLSTLILLYCPPSPDTPTAGMPTQRSVPLSWTAVANTSKYRVEYRTKRASDWTVDDDTLTGTTHTVDGLYCGTDYRLRVSA